MDDTGIIHEDPASDSEQLLLKNPISTPSSPHSEDKVFSSDAHQDSTVSPPSSPPRHLASPPPRSHVPAFSFLKRKRLRHPKDGTAEPLTEISTSSTNMRRVAQPKKKARLTQMQIDLGGEIRKACKDCGMDYTPSNAEDAALHREFHSMNIGGVDMGRGFARDATVVGRVSDGEIISIVEGKSALGIRNKVKKALEIVNQELGAAQVEDADLWGKIPILSVEDKKRREAKRRGLRAGMTEQEKEDRFKVFLYLAKDKCIGLCLAERIHSASKVVGGSAVENAPKQGPTVTARSSSITTETSPDLALLGISRIWTSKSHRRKGIASALLDCARGNFFYGIEVPKEMVAFSQPTESGGYLAEGWFEEKTGWHVYAEY